MPVASTAPIALFEPASVLTTGPTFAVNTITAIVTPPLLALMLVVPAATPVAKPLALMVAVAAVLDAQVSVASCAALAVVPSVIRPLAVNCVVLPTVTAAGLGAMDKVANTAALTVNVIVLDGTPAMLAVMVVVPTATLDTPPVALTVATAGLLDAHVTAPETSAVVPSEYVAVVMNVAGKPLGTDAVVLDTLNEVITATVTFNAAVGEVIPASDAVTVVLPTATPVATPVAAMLAVAGAAAVQVT